MLGLATKSTKKADVSDPGGGGRGDSGAERSLDQLSIYTEPGGMSVECRRHMVMPRYAHTVYNGIVE